MKKSLTGLLVIVLLSIALNSCMNKGKEDVNTSISDQNETVNQPGEDWNLVWSDEFEADSIDATNWNFQVEEAGRFNEEWQRYTKSRDNAYIEDSCLVIKAIHESDSHGIDQYTSARLNTANKHAWTFGKIAARIKLPQGEGIWPAFWMLGANIDENGGDTPWPETGEIDILELYGSKDDGVVEANIHYAVASGEHAMMGAETFELEEGKFADAFHVFELEWDSEKISWFVDGEQYASTPITADELSEFHQDFFLLLNIAVGGTFAGRPDDSTPFPQYMYVDWVRVYEKNN
jgi:beta-glucanase (GH16 family)